MRGGTAREHNPDDATISASGIGPFSRAWGAVLVAGVIAAIVVLVAHAPTERDLSEDAYWDFFATSAQITAALIIALAIEAGQRTDDVTSSLRLEACVCVAIGALVALCGLVPGLPQTVYAAALMIVSSGLIGVMASAPGTSGPARAAAWAGGPRSPEA